MTEQREQGAFKQAATGAGRRLSQQICLLIQSHNRWFRFLKTPVRSLPGMCLWTTLKGISIGCLGNVCTGSILLKYADKVYIKQSRLVYFHTSTCWANPGVKGV